ncbi:MAG: glycosyltransferase [Oscillospiraceae bacterium]|nr:glycosyltransferase [Oscillospiraceae bacterium]
MKSLSIISTTYEKEKGANLDECLGSIFSQTVLPQSVVLVADGHLNDELYEVIDKYKAEYPELFVFYETETNNGNWYASNKAIELCSTDIIAKIDSDDILMPTYAEKILSAFETGIDICGVYIDEFDDGTKALLTTKKTPTKHEEIYKFAKRRNPFNNPGIAFSRKLANEIGGYKNMVRCEDYDFVVRMLMAGAKGMNIPESLVRYRTSKDNMKRRKNFVNTKWFIISRYRIHKAGFSSFSDFLIPSAAQLLLFIMPSGLTGKIYKLLRK